MLLSPLSPSPFFYIMRRRKSSDKKDFWQHLANSFFFLGVCVSQISLTILAWRMERMITKKKDSLQIRDFLFSFSVRRMEREKKLFFLLWETACCITISPSLSECTRTIQTGGGGGRGGGGRGRGRGGRRTKSRMLRKNLLSSSDADTILPPFPHWSERERGERREERERERKSFS